MTPSVWRSLDVTAEDRLCPLVFHDPRLQLVREILLYEGLIKEAERCTYRRTAAGTAEHARLREQVMRSPEELGEAENAFLEWCARRAAGFVAGQIEDLMADSETVAAGAGALPLPDPSAPNQ